MKIEIDVPDSYIIKALTPVFRQGNASSWWVLRPFNYNFPKDVTSLAQKVCFLALKAGKDIPVFESELNDGEIPDDEKPMGVISSQTIGDGLTAFIEHLMKKDHSFTIEVLPSHWSYDYSDVLLQLIVLGKVHFA